MQPQTPATSLNLQMTTPNDKEKKAFEDFLQALQLDFNKQKNNSSGVQIETASSTEGITYIVQKDKQSHLQHFEIRTPSQVGLPEEHLKKCALVFEKPLISITFSPADLDALDKLKSAISLISQSNQQSIFKLNINAEPILGIHPDKKEQLQKAFNELNNCTQASEAIKKIEDIKRLLSPEAKQSHSTDEHTKVVSNQDKEARPGLTRQNAMKIPQLAAGLDAQINSETTRTSHSERSINESTELAKESLESANTQESTTQTSEKKSTEEAHSAKIPESSEKASNHEPPTLEQENNTNQEIKLEEGTAANRIASLEETKLADLKLSTGKVDTLEIDGISLSLEEKTVETTPKEIPDGSSPEIQNDRLQEEEQTVPNDSALRVPDSTATSAAEHSADALKTSDSTQGQDVKMSLESVSLGNAAIGSIPNRPQHPSDIDSLHEQLQTLETEKDKCIKKVEETEKDLFKKVDAFTTTKTSLEKVIDIVMEEKPNIGWLAVIKERLFDIADAIKESKTLSDYENSFVSDLKSIEGLLKEKAEIQASKGKVLLDDHLITLSQLASELLKNSTNLAESNQQDLKARTDLQDIEKKIDALNSQKSLLEAPQGGAPTTDKKRAPTETVLMVRPPLEKTQSLSALSFDSLPTPPSIGRSKSSRL